MSNDKSFITRTIDRFTGWWEYLSEGVWSDSSKRWYINPVKTVNLAIRAFLDRDLQSQAAALTFKTLLAIVPALALLFAISKGFGIQNLLTSSLFEYFPAQGEALDKAMTFVDSYIKSSTEGVFVGVGIVFLLYTLISLLGSVEDAFNNIWNIKQGRSIGRKITDYTAILLLLPILLVCSSGISVFMSTTLMTALPFKFMSPIISVIVDFIGIALGWLFFAGTYALIPNTHVKFKNALIAGVLAGTGYYILQWLFVSGQLYVTRYNAIYGSFAFLPLLLLWLQLVWLITLAGGGLCYASQSINEFNFSNKISDISLDYNRKIVIAVMTVIVKRREQGLEPQEDRIIAEEYGLPLSLVNQAVNELVEARIAERVILSTMGGKQILGVAPALDTEAITLGLVLKRLRNDGTSDFVPDFDTRFENVIKSINSLENKFFLNADEIRLRDFIIK
ncbi:MAG: YihY/virulence factor BrkB family protein [Muribaculaceae bacterium]|nr:YihY/virulence factor BrkB family protein [Muribaculaceae bacterium]